MGIRSVGLGINTTLASLTAFVSLSSAADGTGAGVVVTRSAVQSAGLVEAVECSMSSDDKAIEVEIVQAKKLLGGTHDEQQRGLAMVRRLADQGSANATNMLGWCYANGTGVARDAAEAVKWYRKAAEQGVAKAQFNLGLCYANGDGVPKDMAEAVNWYRKAAEQGFADAQLNLGVAYYYGRSVTKDDAEAVKWYRKAAEQGSADAQNNLGLCYANGDGVAKDQAEAVKWFRKAAEQGNADAQYWLGMCYANGKGVPKDESEAVKWYRKAAEQGHAGASEQRLHTNSATLKAWTAYVEAGNATRPTNEWVPSHVLAQQALSCSRIDLVGVHPALQELIRETISVCTSAARLQAHLEKMHQQILDDSEQKASDAASIAALEARQRGLDPQRAAEFMRNFVRGAWEEENNSYWQKVLAANRTDIDAMKRSFDELNRRRQQVEETLAASR